MKKRFNTTGICIPAKHYMVDISQRVAHIRRMVERGDYFCINRGRQYGKTTTLKTIAKELSDEYAVFQLSLEGILDKDISSDSAFIRTIIRKLWSQIKTGNTQNVAQTVAQRLKSCAETGAEPPDFKDFISELCLENSHPLVLIIDEVDQAGNYDSFLQFLGILRSGYLTRDDAPFLQSVILAGVYDIQHMKLKIRPEAAHTLNSPWNISARFDVDMSLPQDGIKGMLDDYEADNRTGMDTEAMAQLLRDYTNGYPFLVSRLCQILDEELPGADGFPTLADAWTKNGFLKAVAMLLKEENTLFGDLKRKLSQFPALEDMFRTVLLKGGKIEYSPSDDAQHIARMFGYAAGGGTCLVIANPIFEEWLYAKFAYDASKQSEPLLAQADLDHSLFIRNGRLDMKRILERFVFHVRDIYGDTLPQFLENDGRALFMFFLRPIINGTGHCYVEAQTRDRTRTDLVVNYNNEEFVVELKIWHGDAYNTRGEEQLCGYLDHFHVNHGYMVSFCFNRHRESGVTEHRFGDKTVVEALV